jgi:hypothetical protein
MFRFIIWLIATLNSRSRYGADSSKHFDVPRRRGQPETQVPSETKNRRMITEGASEVMRMVIAREVLKKYN